MGPAGKALNYASSIGEKRSKLEFIFHNRRRRRRRVKQNLLRECNEKHEKLVSINNINLLSPYL